MHPTVGPISRLTESAESRLHRLQVLGAPLALPLSPEDHRTLSYVVIEAANLWAQYSRCLYLSAAFGARDITGRRAVARPVSNARQAIDLAVYATHPRLAGQVRNWQSHELPDFQNKGHLAATLQNLSASITAQVDMALSYPTRVLSDLPTMRNFFAHKAADSAAKAATLGRHYGITRPLKPSVLLCTPPAGKADPLLSEWLSDLGAILSLMP
jgi:hypothetical protein